MRISKGFVSLGAVFLAGVQTVLAGPGGFVSLINATPFDWVLVYQHEYQMEWQPKKIIPAGTSHLQYFEYWYHHGNSGDCAAEATYAVMGSPTRQHLTVQARQNGGKRIEIQYHDTLQSLNNPENSLIKLGYVHNGVVQFVLASSDGVSYVSSNPPVAWMQGTLSTIGSKTMRTLSLPASHDSGLSELTYRWTGIPHNTQTQSVHVYKQLLNGARFFDIRPVLYKGKWYTGHFSPFIGRDWVGATGRTIDHIIGDINRFTAEHPGELIVLDITHDANINRWWDHISADEWQNLYVKLSAIIDLWIPENNDNLPYDISTAPISTFIKPGSRSAVIVRIPGSAPEPGTNLHKRAPSTSGGGHPEDGLRVEPSVYETFDHDEIPVLDKENGFGDPNVTMTPPAVLLNAMFSADPDSTFFGAWKQAFFSSNRLPQSGSYAETRWPTKMSSNQLDKLSQRASESDAPHMSYWILTQYWTDVTDFGTPRHSIIRMARKAYRALFTDLWPAMRRENKWPNLIILDDIHNTEVTALCMGINSFFPHPDTQNQFQKRGTLSSGENKSTKTGDETQCEAEIRARDEHERIQLSNKQRKAFKDFQGFQHKQTRDQENHLTFDRATEQKRNHDEMEELHQRQTSETISVNHKLNNDDKISLAEKRKIKDHLADTQSRERLEVNKRHWNANRALSDGEERRRKGLLEEQSRDLKAYLGRQQNAMDVLKYDQKEFLDKTLKVFFGDDKTPFCPNSRHDWPIPKGMPTPGKPHKNFPVYNSTSIPYVPPIKVHSSDVYSTRGYYPNPYLVHPTGAYYKTSKNHYVAATTRAYYTVSPPKNTYAVHPVDYSVLKTTHTFPGKAYYLTSKAQYHVTATGKYYKYPVLKDKYHPVPTGAYYWTSKAPYHVTATGGYYKYPVLKDKYHSVLTGAYYSTSKKVYPTGVYQETSNGPYSVISTTGAYHQSTPTPVNAYSVNLTQGYHPTPNSTFIRPYYHLPSGLKVHNAPYGKPKPVYGKPIWNNGTTSAVKEAYGTNIPLPPYKTGSGPNPYSVSQNITTSEAPQTITVNRGTTTFTEFSTFTAFGTIPASRRPSPTPTPIYVPTSSEEEEPLEPITQTVIGGTITFTEYSTHTSFGILPATPVYKTEKKMTTSVIPAVETPSSSVSTSPPPTSPVPANPAPIPTTPVQTIPEKSTPVPTIPLPTPSFVTANAARTQVWGILGLVFSWNLAFFWGMV